MSPSRSKPASSATVNTDNEEAHNTVTELSIGSAVLDSRIFVLNDPSSSSAGVLYGGWKGEVLPWLREHHGRSNRLHRWFTGPWT